MLSPSGALSDRLHQALLAPEILAGWQEHGGCP